MRPIAVTLNRHTLGRWLVAGFLAAIVLVTVASAAEYNPVRTKPTTQEPPTVQRVIVKFRQASRLSAQATTSGESGSVAAAAAADTARLTSLASRARITMHASRAIGGNMHVMQVSPLTNNETAAETLARLRADSEVELAVADRRVYSHATSNDPLAAVTGPGLGQWYLTNAQPSAIDANGAWNTTKGSNGVVIAVVDTGVLFGHPDLLRASSGGKLLPGYDFVSADSAGVFTTANDGNGRDSDPSDPGDWVSAADNCGSTPVSNSSWHGTRVSGIIGALTNNSVGVAGINWDGYILPVRVLGKCGGFNSDVLAGILWAAGFPVTGIPANPYPAKVINISLGGTGTCDQASADVINQVTTAGVLVVVSAGNEGGPVDSPANCPGAMGIVGLRHAGTKVGFSSLGPEIALGAPGGNCVNTGSGQACLFSLDTTSNSGATSSGTNIYTDDFNTNLGTSFSAPIVSGIAGLMLSVNGNLKSSQLIARLKEGSKPFPTTSDTTPTPPTCKNPSTVTTPQNSECICTTSTCGAGMANANGAVAAALRPIGAILASTGFAGGQNVTLDASGSAAACGRVIAGYSWSVNGTQISNGPVATLQAPASTPVVVHLTVTDDAPTPQTDSADITINPTSTSTSAPSSAGNKACLTAVTPPAGVTIAATDANAAETGGDTGTFTVTRTGSTAAALPVSLSITGTATNGVDYQTIANSVTIPAGATTATITVTPIDDAVVDPGETVIATIQPGSGYDVGASNSATVTIADDDVAVTISASDSSAAETGADPGVFLVSRTGGSTTAALTVNLAISGTATNGTDYQTIPSTVTIPAGSASATVTVTPVDDSVVDPAETVIATLQAGTGYVVGAPFSATVTIADNDTASAAPPPTNTGGGGGGAFDPLTLLGGLAFATYAALRRHGAVATRVATSDRAPT